MHKPKTKKTEDIYDGTDENNYALQLEGRAYGPHNPDMQKREAYKTNEVPAVNKTIKNNDKSLLLKKRETGKKGMSIS